MATYKDYYGTAIKVGDTVTYRHNNVDKEGIIVKGKEGKLKILAGKQYFLDLGAFCNEIGVYDGYYIKVQEGNMDERQELSGQEMQEVKTLVGALSMLGSLERLKKKLKDLKLWKDLEKSVSIQDNILTKLYDTIPIKQLQRLEYFCRNYEATIKLKKIVKEESYVHLSTSELNILLDIVLKENCSICIKEGIEVKTCKLKKLFDSLGVDKEEKAYGDCKYSYLSEMYDD